MVLCRFLILILITPYIWGCVEKTIYSGKIINKDNFDIQILNKKELLNKFGQPSYVDNLLNKYFYFTEKKQSKNFYENNIIYSYLFVFELDKEDKIVKMETIDLQIDTNHRYKKEQTDSNIIERGLLEKFFGGIGQNRLPNSP